MTRSRLFGGHGRGRSRSSSRSSSRGKYGRGHNTTTTRMPPHRAYNNHYRQNRQMPAPGYYRQPAANPNYVRQNYNPNVRYNNPSRTPQYYGYPQNLYQRGQRYNIR